MSTEPMTPTMTPLDAYLASQGASVGYSPEWRPEVRQWASETFGDPIGGYSHQNRVRDLYEAALKTPGYDFRMGWLPPLREILPATFGESHPSDMFRQLANFGGSGSWLYGTAGLYMTAPLAADAIYEEVTAFQTHSRYSEVDKYRGLLANPNAPVDWLIDHHAEMKRSALSDTSTSWNDPENFTSILRNPSMPSDWLASALFDLVHDKRWASESSDDALTALAWNPSLTAEAVKEVFPGGVVAPPDHSSVTPFPFHGTLAQGQEGVDFTQPPVTLPLHVFGPLLEAFNAQERARNWVKGIDKEVRPRITLKRMAHLPTVNPDTFELVERFHLDSTLTEVRAEVYEAVAEGRLPWGPTASVAHFFANRHRQVEELKDSFGDAAADVPDSWVHALL